MLSVIYYLSAFFGTSTSLYLSTQQLESGLQKQTRFSNACLMNALLIFLGKLLALVPLIGFVLAIGSLILAIKIAYQFSWVNSIIVLLIQIFALGGIKALLGFFIVGYFPLI